MFFSLFYITWSLRVPEVIFVQLEFIYDLLYNTNVMFPILDIWMFGPFGFFAFLPCLFKALSSCLDLFLIAIHCWSCYSLFLDWKFLVLAVFFLLFLLMAFIHWQIKNFTFFFLLPLFPIFLCCLTANIFSFFKMYINL